MKKRNFFAKTIGMIVGVIGVASAIGLGSVAYAASANLNEKFDVPTQYTVPDVAVQAEKPAVERNYTVGDNPLNNTKPTTNDISRDQAADIGAAELAKVFGIDLSGREILMDYSPTRDDHRASWDGEVLFSGDWKTGVGYVFSVNAMTGEISSIGGGRSTIDANVPLDFDAAVAKNPEVYESLAKEIAEKYGIVGGKVRSAAYANQGYYCNDPTVTILVIGENGQHAQLTFSRYDQTFLGAMYNSAMLDFYAWAERAEAGELSTEEEQAFG